MHLVTDKSVPPAEGQVRVKMLKHVNNFKPHDIVDCSEKDAEVLCRIAYIDDGQSKKIHCKAMRLDESLKAEEAHRNPALLTKSEMQAMGIKNIVDAPKDEPIMLEKEAEADGETDAPAAEQKGKKSKKGK